MNLMLVCRAYSGLDLDAWHNAGTPAATRLIERLEERGIATTVAVVAKRKDELVGLDGQHRMPRFEHVRFFVIPWSGMLEPHGVGQAINFVLQLRALSKLLARTNPDAVWVDRGNLEYAAWMAWFTRRPILWRCLGAAPFVALADSRGLRQRLLARWYGWLARAPFALIICTRDGSPWWRFFADGRARRRLAVLWNGIDLPPADGAAERAERPMYPTILFVGRLIPNKHVLVLADVLRRLRDRGHRFHAIVAGYGPLLDPLRAFVAENGLEDCVDCPGRVPRDTVSKLHADADIFVNLSRGGQMGNALLEAMAAGLCTVALSEDPHTETDMDTWRTIPADALMKVGREDISGNLEAALDYLLNNPAEVAARGERARRFVEHSISSWEERLDLEIGLLSDAAAGRAPRVLEGTTAASVPPSDPEHVK